MGQPDVPAAQHRTALPCVRRQREGVGGVIRTYTFDQGSDEWEAARLGMVTASVMGQLVTPTLKVAANMESRAITALLAAERITGWVDERFVGADMERGWEDEPLARDLYSKTYAPVTEVGLITRDDWGFTIGCSPDGLVGEVGGIEIKSRRPKKHLATILANQVPAENMAQVQTSLLVTGREWWDFLSYCGGMPMWRIRVYPDPDWQAAIIAAVQSLEDAAADMIARYTKAVHGLPPTERTLYDIEMKVA